MTPAPQARSKPLAFLARHGIALVSILVVLAYAMLIQYLWTWEMLWRQWQAIGIVRVAGAMIVLLMTHLVRSYRIYDYFLDARGRFWRLFRVAQLHNLINIVFPFRSGEASFPLLMRSEFSVPLARSTAALVWMRALDLHALLGVAGLAFLIGSDHGVALFVVWAAFCLLPLGAMMLQAPVSRLALRIRSERLRALMQEAVAGLPATHGRFLRAWFLTLVNWSAKLVAIGWIVGLLGVDPFVAAIGGSVGGELSSVLPFHAPAGVGTYPAGITAGALAFGYDPRQGALDLLARAAVNAHILVFVSALVSTAISLTVPSRR